MNTSEKSLGISKRKTELTKTIYKLEEKGKSVVTCKEMSEGSYIIEENGIKNDMKYPHLSYISEKSSKNFNLNKLKNYKRKSNRGKVANPKSPTKKIDNESTERSVQIDDSEKKTVNESSRNDNINIDEEDASIKIVVNTNIEIINIVSSDLNMVTNQSSKNLDNKVQMTGNVSPIYTNDNTINIFSNKFNNQPKIKLYNKIYSDHEVNEIFNFKRNILEMEEELLNTRLPDYLRRQKYLSNRMRLILLDWMMELCAQLGFKRNTYHSAVLLVDIYLSKVPDIETNIFQLIGVTCLIIAAKNEEITIPTMDAFSHFTNYAYKTEEIIEFERYALNTFKWRVQYPSMAFWSNYISFKWDIFVDEFPLKHSYDLDPLFKKINLPKFRSKSDEEYYFFRNFYQIIDVISLDLEYLKYSEKLLCAATIYLLLGLYLKIFNISNIIKEFWKDESIYSNFYELNVIFSKFVNIYLECRIDYIIPHAMYVCFFFNLKFDYSSPKINKDEGDCNLITYEEYLQTQTHNSNNIPIVEHIISIRNEIFNNYYDNSDNISSNK